MTLAWFGGVSSLGPYPMPSSYKKTHELGSVLLQNSRTKIKGLSARADADATDWRRAPSQGKRMHDARAMSSLLPVGAWLRSSFPNPMPATQQPSLASSFLVVGFLAVSRKSTTRAGRPKSGLRNDEETSHPRSRKTAFVGVLLPKPSVEDDATVSWAGEGNDGGAWMESSGVLWIYGWTSVCHVGDFDRGIFF